MTNARWLSTGSIYMMHIAGGTAAGVIVGFASIEWAFATVVVIYSVALFLTVNLHAPDH